MILVSKQQLNEFRKLLKKHNINLEESLNRYPIIIPNQTIPSEFLLDVGKLYSYTITTQRTRTSQNFILRLEEEVAKNDYSTMS